jgi:hypothetical protein
LFHYCIGAGAILCAWLEMIQFRFLHLVCDKNQSAKGKDKCDNEEGT